MELMSRRALLRKLEQQIESQDILGFDIGEGEEVVDFLARLEMDAVEQFLNTEFTDHERELVLNWVEERKGQLRDHELPALEAERRAEHRKRIRRRRF
ncbi:MAG: hypothetical protein WEE89_05630 [Gemmatimonadota bacterium]